MPDAPEGKPYIGQELLAGLAERVGKQLCHIGLNGDGGLAYREELIDKGEDHNKPYADGPSPDGAAWCALIVVVVNHGTHLGVRTVYRDQGRL